MAKVQFKRIEDSSNIDNIPVVDGQLIYTKDGKHYTDYGQERVELTPESSSGGGGVLLWTNPNPNSNFNEQTITLRSGDYDVIEVYASIQALNQTEYMVTSKILKTKASTLNSYGYSGDNLFIYVRGVSYNINDNTKVKIFDCHKGTSVSANNQYLIPQYIYGYKLSN